MKKKLLIISTLVLTLAFTSSYGQLTYLIANAKDTAGTYTDLGTNGTIITTANFDDANSAAQPIGFTFSYGCTTFTQFVLNTNGFIKLGSANPSAPNLFFTTATGITGGPFNSTDTADVNIISPFNRDLKDTTGAEYRVYTTGAAGSRITTIQFKNLIDKLTPTTRQYNSIEFQIKLYETSNKIEFVYGTWVPAANAAAFESAILGLKVNTTTIVATKTSGTAWGAATFLNSNYTLNSFNNKNSFLPDVGRTFRFVPSITTNDVAVTAVFALGKLPVGLGVPHIVTARLVNNNNCSSATLVATLNVSGANTFTNTQNVTIPASGSMDVSFTAYSPATIGINTVTVTIPADGNNTNNSLSYRQDVNSNTYSYADTSAVTGSIGYNTGGGLILNKYIVTGSATINSVNIFVANNPATTGKKVLAVLLNAAGTIIGTSDTLVLVAGDLNKYHSFAIKVPPTVTGAAFYAGLAQIAGTPGYYPVGTQTEVTPGRSGAYYTAGLAGGTTTEGNTFGRFVIDVVVTNVTGIVSYDLSNNLLVYPNPTKDQLNLFYTNLNAKSFDIKLTNINGQVLFSENIEGFNGQYQHTLDVSNYAKGIYLLQIISNKQVLTKKVVID